LRKDLIIEVTGGAKTWEGCKGINCPEPLDSSGE